MKTRNLSSEVTIAAGQYIKERDYWLEQLSGELVKSCFPYDHKRSTSSPELAKVEFEISGPSYLKLIRLTRGGDQLLHTALTALSILQLHRYTGNEDIIIGTPIYRQEINVEFINTILAIRTCIRDNISFKEFLLQVKQTIVEASENLNYPIETLCDMLDIQALENGFPLFDLAILLEEIHERDYIRHINLNMIFSFIKADDRIDGVVEYNPSLYEKATIERITTHFTYLLGEVLSHLTHPLGDIPMLSPEEKNQLLYEFNDTKAKYPVEKTISRIFEEQVEKIPDNIALVGPAAVRRSQRRGGTASEYDAWKQHVTYRELNKRANRLARLLRKKGVRTDSIIGLMMERSVHMVVGIIAVLKAGGAYLPIDPDSPENRIVSILKDSQVSLLLTGPGIFDKYSFTTLLRLRAKKMEVKMTGLRPQITDFNGLPFPDRSLIDYEKYNQYIGLAMVKNCISLQGTRGCPYNCAYCHKIWPKNHIVRSADNIFEEMRAYYDMGVQRFALIDDIFNLNKKNSTRFFELIINHGLDAQLFFPNGVRGDLLTKEYIDLMVKAGTVSVALALETASPRLQKLVEKNLNLEKLRENIDYFCEKHPYVILELFAMHGFPTETTEEAKMTLDFIKKIKWLHFPYFHILKIYPNTDMEKLAVQSGISREAISRSVNLAYHELPDTLPFDKSYTLKCQSDFFNGYFLSKERLLHVLPYQVKHLSEDEIVQKYNSYLPVEIKSFAGLLKFVGIKEEELETGDFLVEGDRSIPLLNKKMKDYFIPAVPNGDALRVLFLDLSHFFSNDTGSVLYDVVEPPLGLLYVMTHLNRRFGSKINGRIAKSRIDFDNYAELKSLLDEFKPHVIGLRTLTYYKDFFHKAAAMIRQWGIEVPVIAGGPYATSDYKILLQDKNIDLVVLSEGEITAAEVLGKIMENDGKLPGEAILKKIEGIAYIPKRGGIGKDTGPEIVMLNECKEVLAGETGGNPVPVNQQGDLAYVIYTSGSTGTPKGAVIEHRNVVRLMFNDRNLFDFDSSDVWTMFHSYCFDFSVWEMYGALLYGGKLIVIPKTIARNLERFLEILKEEQVSVLNQTPPAFYNLINEELKAPGERNLNIKYIIFGGEALKPARLKEWKDRYPKTKLVNMYGITETTVHVTFKEIGDKEITLNKSNIGKPLPTTSCLVLGRDLKLLPLNVPGELCVGGDGVCRGYLNRPGLTAEKFVKNPYIPGERLYLSRDLVRLSTDGEMEYLGRSDYQVKIRGFRIEPGEIENQLLQHDDVREAIVAEGTDLHGEKYLCAYLISDNEISIPGLRAYLSMKLPDYMIPSYFVQLSEIPLTPNGKLDKKALSMSKAGLSSRECIGPGNETEKKLAPIWQQVLGIENCDIDIEENFFEIGGHSLKAAVLIAKIHKEFNVKIPLEEILSNPTIKGLSEYIRGTVEDMYSAIELVEEKEYYPLSSAQKRLYILHQMGNSTRGYNIYTTLSIEGVLDRKKLESVFCLLVTRHDNLRTSFLMINEEPVQRIYHDAAFEIENFDLSIKSAEDLQSTADSIIETFNQPFDLSRPPLLRVGLMEIAKNKYVLMVDMHHIIADGVSAGIMVTEFMELYGGKYLPTIRTRYKDYVQWQNSISERKTLKEQEIYWLKEFQGDSPPLDLPTDFARPAEQTFEGEHFSFEIGAKERKKLIQLALKRNTTIYTVLLTIFNVFLYKLNGPGEFVVGTPVAGRRHEDLRHIVGMFVNTLVLKNFSHGEKIFKEFLDEVKNRTLEAFENQEYPFEELVDKVVTGRDVSRNPLFDVMFSFQNMDNPEIKLERLTLKTYEFKRKIARFDITLNSFDAQDKLLFTFVYSTGLFRMETIKRYTRYFKKIVDDVITNPGIKISDIQITPGDTREEKLNYFNEDLKETAAIAPLQVKLAVNFQKYRPKTAIEQGPIHVTYGELESRACSVCQRIIRGNIKKGSIIGIYMNDKIDIISVIIGILYADCVFVPLDTGLPVNQLASMIQLADIQIIFTDKDNERKLSGMRGHNFDISLIEVIGPSFYQNMALTLHPADEATGTSPSGKIQEIGYHGEDKAYIYFTSGTTGKPNAIIGKNESLVQFIRWEIDTFSVDRTYRFSQLTAVGFDAFLRDVFTPLFAGGAVCIPESPDLVMDSEGLVNWIDENRITFIHCVPSVFRLINGETATADRFAHLKYIAMSGEQVSPGELRKWYNTFADAIQLVNYYGPTETTLIKTFHLIEQKDIENNRIPVGTAMRGARTIILDRHLKVCDAGIVGEIYIRTPYRTYGYLDAPELNAQRFIKNPFDGDNSEDDIIFKTGDLGRELENGELEVLGRIDRQVKIRGVRIELESIENCLAKYEKIDQAVVVSQTDGNSENVLCAYIVYREELPPGPGKNLTPSELRKYLQGELPDYMIPSYFMTLENIPLTSNGKVDQKALPEPVVKGGGEGRNAAGDKLEKRLAEIWWEILNPDGRKVLQGIIARDDNFFQLGGHSLKAVVLASKIHREFHVAIPLLEIFKAPTIRGLSTFIKRRALKKSYQAVTAAEKKEYYFLSSAQKRLYVLQNIETGNTAYNMPKMFRLAGNLNINKLQKVFRKLIARHESLRTSFEIIEGEPVQKVHHEVDFVIDYFNLTAEIREKTRSKNKIHHSIRQFVYPFDLSRAPLLRVGLIREDDKNHILMVDMHHIISDGISSNVFVSEFMAFYRGEKLPPLKLRYIDYSEKQGAKNQKEMKAFKTLEDFWLGEFAGELPVSTLPTDFARPAAQNFAGNRISFKLGAAKTKKLKEFANEKKVTIFMVLLAAYSILLAKLSGQEDIIVGFPTAGRWHTDLRNVIGMFVNTLALRNYTAGEKSFILFLEEVKNKTLEALENQDYPFEILVEKVEVRRDASRNPVFDHMFVLQNQELAEIKIPGLKLKQYEYENGISQVDLKLQAVEIEENLSFIFEFCVKLFTRETIERFVGYFKKILFSVIDNPGIKISEIEIITADEKKQVLHDFNDTTAGYPGEKTIHELFKEQTQKRPGNTAILFKRKQLTYRELDQKSDKLAGLLKTKGVNPGCIVGIMLKRSVEMMISLMAILKAGSAYLPIDPQYPEASIKYILEDSSTKLVITRGQFMNPLELECETIDIDNKKLFALDIKIPGKTNTSKDMAYVIYTSGSTGKPKGVIIEHRSIVNRLNWMQKEYPLSEKDVILQKTPFTFDVSVWELFWWATMGAAVCFLSPGMEKEPAAIVDAVDTDNISVIHFVPSMLNVFLEYCENFVDLKKLKSLRMVFSSGEALSAPQVSLFNKLLNRANGTRLFNLYGPTEASIDVSAFDCSKKENLKKIPIGKPVDNIKLFIVTKEKGLQPVGVPGELYIAGVGLARGYLNKTGLTDEKFIESSFLPGERMYATGDCAKWLQDGNIDFIGRIDNQVKIRGSRIELGEIEIQLSMHDHIKESVVTAVESRGESTSGSQKYDKYLCAYFVSEKEIDMSGLREYLSQKLPGYMIPSYFIRLDQIPLKSNGKIDFKALPVPKIEAIEKYAAPGNEIEEKLAAIWQEVLGIKEIGINDNFFQMGGDSIKAIQVATRLLRYRLKIEIKDIFLNPTIRGLGKCTRRTERQIPQGTVKGEVELTPIQKHFFENHSRAPHHFNQAVMLYREKGFDVRGVEKVFEKIVEHHDTLRMVFERKNGRIVQKNRGLEGELFSIEIVNAAGTANDELEEETRREANLTQGAIDLSTGPLVKLKLFKTLAGDYLLIVIHHLVVDGISWRILLEDITVGYEQFHKGEKIRFQEKTDSFKDYALNLKEYSKSKRLLEELPYWKWIEETKVELLPVDFKIDGEKRKYKNIESINLNLNKEDTGKLLKEVNQAYNTEINDILLAALAMAIKEWAGIQNISIDLEGHGREGIGSDMDITRTVGWFTSLFPVVVNMQKVEKFSYGIKYVKEILRAVPNKGMGYGILRYLTVEKNKKGKRFNREPELIFNYLGQFGGENDGAGKGIEISTMDIGNSIAPESERQYSIDISGIVMRGILNLSFSYNRYEYKKNTMEKLVKSYEKYLQAIIEHCCQKEEKELTPSDLDYPILTIEKLEELENRVSKMKNRIRNIYKLSPMQSAMLFLYYINKKSDAFFMQVELTFKGEINLSLLEKSFNRLIEKYDILRTIFIYDQADEPLQIVLNERVAKIYFEDISYLSEFDTEAYVKIFKKKERVAGFDLTKDLLMKISLFKTTDNSYKMIWSYHHILMDGWCMGLIYKDLFEIYGLLKKRKVPRLDPAAPYANYIKWLDRQDTDEGLNYWKKYLEGYNRQAHLPVFNPWRIGNKYELEEYDITIDETLTGALLKIAGKCQVTLHTVFQAIWGIILQQYNNTNDVVFGTVVSGRPPGIEEIEHMIGLFINTVPVRIKTGPGQNFYQVLKLLQDEAVLSKSYEYLPLAKIQSNTLLKRELLNHIMVFENYPVEEKLKNDGKKRETGFKVEDVTFYGQTNYQFNILIGLTGRQLKIKCKFNSLTYSTTFIKKIGVHLRKIIERIVAAESPTIGELRSIISYPAKVGAVGINMERVEKRDFYEPSYNQVSMLLRNSVNTETEPSLCTITDMIKIEPNVDEVAVEKALYRIVERHETLRTKFAIVDNKYLQFVLEQIEIPFTTVDISLLSEKEKERKIKDVIVREEKTPFKFNEAPLFRVVLLRADDEKSTLIFIVHRGICDRWSMEVMKKEFSCLYKAYHEGKATRLNSSGYRYLDFSAWHSKHMDNLTIRGKSHEFWRKKLGGDISVIKLPGDFGSDSKSIETSAYFSMNTREQTERLKRFARDTETGLFPVMFSTFNLLLSRFSGEKDIVSIVVAAGRESVYLENIIGPFSNHVPMKNHLDYEERYSDFLRRVAKEYREMLPHQRYPVELILNELKIKLHEISVKFDMFTFDAAAKDDFASHSPCFLRQVQDNAIDIALYITVCKDHIKMEWHYKTGRFKKERVEYMLMEYEDLLNRVTRDPNKKLREYLSRKKKRKIQLQHQLK